jgi:hypothetical protein
LNYKNKQLIKWNYTIEGQNYSKIKDQKNNINDEKKAPPIKINKKKKENLKQNKQEKQAKELENKIIMEENYNSVNDIIKETDDIDVLESYKQDIIDDIKNNSID